jgi:hypothetical protein
MCFSIPLLVCFQGLASLLFILFQAIVPWGSFSGRGTGQLPAPTTPLLTCGSGRDVFLFWAVVAFGMTLLFHCNPI